MFNNNCQDDFTALDSYEDTLERELQSMEEKGFSQKMHLLSLMNEPAKDRMSPKLNDSSLFAWCGVRRSGKSVNAICQAFAIDPDFSIENVAFTFQDLKELIYSKQKVALVWDEASVTAYARDFMTRVNKDMNKFFQVFGYRRICIIATFQSMAALDAELRRQIDAVFWCRSHDYRDKSGEPATRKFIMPFKVKKNPFDFPKITPWSYLPTKNSPNPVNIGWIQVPEYEKLLNYYGVSKQFMKDYQKKKQEFFESMDQDEDSEETHIDKRWLQTVEKQQNALKTSINYMSTKLGMTQKEISSAIQVPRSTINTWDFFPQN